MTALANMVDGLSQSNLSNYERGRGVLSSGIKERIMNTLDFPLSFLDKQIENRVESQHYRKRTSDASEAQKKMVDRKIALFAYLYDWMADFVELPPFAFKCVDLDDGASASDVASQVRRQFKLGMEPVRDICNLLEANGVSVYFWDCGFDWFDGVSLITDNGHPFVIVNRNKPNDRIRFSLAHELGHILMHEDLSFFVNEARNKEQEAYDFASELLMPTAYIRDSLVGLNLKYLCQMKRYWKVSMAALLYKAYKMGCIDAGRYKYFRTELSRNHWSRNEPIDVDIDEPMVIRSITSLLSNELGLSTEDISERSSIPTDIVKEMIQEKKPKVISLF